MRRISRLIIFFLLILIVSLFPISLTNLSNLFSRADVDDQGNITKTEIWDQDKIVDHDYTVQSGATLIVKNGVTINFAGGNIRVLGKMFIEGTLNSPVKIKKGESSRPYVIAVYNNGEINIRNADISGGGYKACMIGKQTIFNAAYACEWRGAIYSEYGKLDIQNVSFHDNDVAISVVGRYYDSGNNIRVNRSEFSNNLTADVYVGGFNSDLDFRYNWWGSVGGPIQTCEDDYCWYEKMEGRIDYSDWRTEKAFHDPVIIVPGIMGSAKKDNKWVIDPIGHVYDNLYSEFTSNGYLPEKDLFTFPYDWENSNVDTAKLLEQKIQDVKEKTHWPKVDLVAHSMGGLVARQYIESDDSIYGYKGDVDQLITLGTPHNGAPEAYLKWEGNAWFWGTVDLYGKHILNQEVKESDGKYVDGFDYIHNKPVASLQELLPVYNYLQDVENDYKYKNYPTGYPKNDFLDNLNYSTNIQKLNKVEFDKIIGNTGNNRNTISGFKIIKTDIGKLWQDGYPLGFEIPIGDRGMAYGIGDETVPLESARSENIPADYIKEINSVHSNLPTKAQKDILELLTNKRPSSEINESIFHQWLFVSVFSPIDIQVIAPDGVHWTGKKIDNSFLDENQIDGAYYTGYDTDNEFVTIPNPEDGEYRVIKQGTGDGEYKIEVANISEDENEPGQATESVVDVTGTAVKDKIEESVATVAGDNVVSEATADTIPPVITATVSPEANENGWNNSDVAVHFDATDDSGIKSVTPDVTLIEEKENQSATGTAEDNAGNVSNKIISGINIDKTAPKTVANLTGIKGNSSWYTSPVAIHFSAADNLSGTEKTFYALDGSDEKIGDALTISTDGIHQIKYYSIDKAGNHETEKNLEIKIDQGAPSIKIISPQNAIYKNSAMLAIKYTVSDEQSAADRIMAKVFYDGKEINQNKIDLSLEKLGAHSVAVIATDEAGNQSYTNKIDFSIKTDIKSISQNIQHYFSLGLIKTRATEMFLELQLRNIEELTRLLDTFQSRWMPRWAKDRVVQSLKQNINRQIDSLENQIQHNRSFQKTIDSKVQIILLEDLEAVKV